MSCGKPHEMDCADVLRSVYLYLDAELTPPDRARIAQHLTECAPCLAQYGLEDVVKSLLRRSCGHDAAPEVLRAKVRWHIEHATVETFDVRELRRG